MPFLFALAIRLRLAFSTRVVLIGGAVILVLMGAAELIARSAEREKIAEPPVLMPMEVPGPRSLPTFLAWQA